jgi:hypothetical protein
MNGYDLFFRDLMTKQALKKPKKKKLKTLQMHSYDLSQEVEEEGYDDGEIEPIENQPIVMIDDPGEP